MNVIDEVSKTGMAIEQAVRIIDTATPEGQDLSPEYDYAMRAPLYALAHWGIENGLKALIWQVEGDHPRGHDLGKLFRRLKRKAPVKAKHLEDAFTDTVNFYTIDKEQWVHFQSLSSYLGEYGKEDRYETFRYWALEDSNLFHIPLFVHRELLVFLEKFCQWGKKYKTSQRVEWRVNWGYLEGKREHVNSCDICLKDYPESMLEILQRLYPSSDKLSCILRDAYNHNFNIGDDDCINRVIIGTVEFLEKCDDPAVKYYADRLKDLPEGSIPLPSDIELDVKWPVADTFGIVKIRNGERLGTIRYSIDSRWCAGGSLSKAGAKFAKTKTDAMNWLVIASTEVVEVTVDRGPHTPKRAMSPVLLTRSRSGDGPWSPYKITFVNHAHGLSVGQHIAVRGGRPIPIGIADGIISRVDGGLVEYGDEDPIWRKEPVNSNQH